MSDYELTKALCDIERGLTPWEVEFVESIAKQVQDRTEPLTPKQRKIAERILEEKG